MVSYRSAAASSRTIEQAPLGSLLQPGRARGSPQICPTQTWRCPISTVALAYDARHGPSDDDVILQAALADAGAQVLGAPWQDAQRWEEIATDVDLVVPRRLFLDPPTRERLLAWGQRIEEVSRLAVDLDVLRWNSHRSFLMELEERGAPLVPTAWMAQGDQIDLDALLRARGWRSVQVLSAVNPGQAPVPATGGASQRDLDEALAVGDALLRPTPSPGTITLGVVVIAGKPSHVVAGEAPEQQRVDDDEAAALGAWMVEATGIELPLVRVILSRDTFGTLQLVDVEALAPELSLSMVPEAASAAAQALLARVATI